MSETVSSAQHNELISLGNVSKAKNEANIGKSILMMYKGENQVCKVRTATIVPHGCHPCLHNGYSLV